MDSHNGRLPIEDEIDVISVGMSFLRFLELATKLRVPVAVVTDNDGDPAALRKKYADYGDVDHITISYDNVVDKGDLKIGDKSFNYNTLEPKLLKSNDCKTLGTLFHHIFVDEVQDLAGYDLDILAAFFRSAARVLLVGDPRQVTYLTHHEAKHEKYADGRLTQFLKEKLPRKIPYEIDETTLNTSHRNSAAICHLSSHLYPDLTPIAACKCEGCRDKEIEAAGIFFVRRADYARYVETYRPLQLRDRITSLGVDQRFPAMNFGESKGCGFDRVVILPTRPMLKWLRDVNEPLKPRTRAKFYVALTRARHSVALVADWRDEDVPPGFSIFR